MNINKIEMDIKTPNGAKEIIERLQKHGYSAYIVGGYIRNAVMARHGKKHSDNTEENNTDIDICTSATPDCMIKLFSDKGVIPTGLKHGTVTVVIDHIPYEATTFRRDGEYSDHRRPDEVYFSTELYDDLSRRDFTVNAMAYDGGVVYDFFGGERDIQHRIVRCVGLPEKRFAEDALRILRALRFASQLDFGIETETEKYAFKMSNLLKYVSVERSVAELQKLLMGNGAERISHAYIDILKTVFSEIMPLPHDTPHDIHIRLASVFGTEDSIKSLKLSKKNEQMVRFLIRNKHLEIPQDRSGIKRKMRLFGYECFRKLCIFKKNNIAKEICDDIVSKGECYSLAQLEINGSDIVKMGIPEGREIRRLLFIALDNVLDGKIKNERKYLLSFVKNTKKLL